MGLLDLLFPKKCLECGQTGKYICGNCLKKVPPGGWINKETYSCFKYGGVIRKAIIALKYKYSAEIAGELAEICVKNLISNHFISGYRALVPIPLHWYRQNFRGFNQAEIIGEKIAKKMGWRFIPELLIKTKSTKSQVELKGPDRRKNLSGVFSLNPGILVSKYPSIILFDDVYTTGSTLSEAAKVLRRAGVKNVWGLTIAR
ncbi:hypothetical protein COT08_00355 [Candidatus Woesebacteria bacterium CG07_land_8_20_14_0_80_44_9]|uniref:Phosphoribosyltransferase domain-containing protein n=2 Tax=Candidatus Woeseibacteriota TaxID=1752722 RepID=A0A2M6YF82_9BACT|nr:MAG: hypothetical protein COT08_00355 [Candidatus Woesebacteria bacterium CG07_land_8_20_14_0_80_44_9]PIZ45726.1 MAG: hypothetical protein COY30_01505 [Candidatus Woesebacteria bacterium CG_4_10_14_0_2_um_filter_44_9]